MTLRHAVTLEPADPTVRVMDGLRRLVRALRTSARSGGGARSPGLSGAQVFVLRQLAAAPGLSLGELAARTLARQSTVSEVVARLVARGLVRRVSHAADARRTLLALTPAGERAVARVPSTVQERLAAGLAMLPPARRRALADSLEAWLAAAGLAGTPATMFFEDGRAPGTRSVRAASPPRRTITRR